MGRKGCKVLYRTFPHPLLGMCIAMDPNKSFPLTVVLAAIQDTHGKNTTHAKPPTQRAFPQIPHAPTPPPCSFTPFLSSTSTFLLSNCLSSGLMTFSLALPFPSSPLSIPALLPGRLRPSTADVAPELPGLGEDDLSAGLRWRTVGVGKLLRLSTASTVR